MADIIIADSGPVIMAAQVGLLPLLKQQFAKIILTNSVYEECCAAPSLPGAHIIQHAVQKKILSVMPDPVTHPNDALMMLGKGEAASIRLATAQNSRLLIDDALGRKLAQRQGVTIIGTLGLLLLLKQQQHITTVAPYIEALQNHGYFLSPTLIDQILQAAGESPLH